MRSAALLACLAAVICVAAALAGCTPRGATGTAATGANGVPLAGTVGPPEEGAYIGVFRPPAPFQISAFDEYGRVSPRRPAILMWYQPWAPGGISQFDAAACVSAFQRGAVPMITWEPWDPGDDSNLVEDPTEQTEYQLQRIVDGSYDDYIRAFARGARSVGGPIMLRPLHEMNGNWYPWSGTVNDNTPEKFRAAWIHIHRLFDEEGATNVTWVWSINARSVPLTDENSYAAYYPGDEWVDWTGISGFNWGTSRSDLIWETFPEIYENPIDYLETLDKPIAISEFASVEQGGSKARWIRDAYERIEREHPSVRAVVYYDSLEQRPGDRQDWRIQTSDEAAAAYANALESPHFVEGPMPELQAWLDQLDRREWIYLRSLDPIY